MKQFSKIALIFSFAMSVAPGGQAETCPVTHEDAIGKLRQMALELEEIQNSLRSSPETNRVVAPNQNPAADMPLLFFPEANLTTPNK